MYPLVTKFLLDKLMSMSLYEPITVDFRNALDRVLRQKATPRKMRLTLEVRLWFPPNQTIDMLMIWWREGKECGWLNESGG